MRKKRTSAHTRRFGHTVHLAHLAGSSTAPPRSPDDRLLTVPEAAKMLRVSRGLVYVMIQAGELPSITFRRVRRIRFSDLQRFIDESWMGAAAEDASALDPHQPKPDAKPVQGRLAKWKAEHGEH